MSIYADAVQKTFGPGAIVQTLAASGAITVDARGMAKLSVIAGTGATVTVSRVDSADADAHTTGTENTFDVAANTIETIDVDWPFYRISSAGGDARFALL